MRRILIIVDSFLAVLFGLCLMGLAVVFIEGRDDLDALQKAKLERKSDVQAEFNSAFGLVKVRAIDDLRKHLLAQ